MSNPELEAARALVAKAEADARAERRSEAQAIIDACDALRARLEPAVAEVQVAIEEAVPAMPATHVSALRQQQQSLTHLLELPSSLREHQVQILKANREPEA